MARRLADPYASFNYVLDIDGVESGGFSECTGLQMEIKTFDYKEGGRNGATLKFPEHASFGNVTLKRGVTKSNDLLNWMLDASTEFFQRGNGNGIKFIIALRNERGEYVKQWNLIRAFPVKWTGPDLKASGGEIAVESLEIAHEGILLVP